MIKKLISYGKKHNIAIEVNKIRNKKTEINYLNDKMQSFEISDITSYIIKGIYEEKSAIITTQEIKPEIIIDNFERIFALQENKNTNRLSKGNSINKKEVRSSLDYEKVKKDLASMYNSIKDKYPKVYSLELAYGHYEEDKTIQNIEADFYNETCHDEFSFALTMQDGQKIETVYLSFYAPEYDFNSFKKQLEKKAEELSLKLCAQSIKTQKGKVILTNNAVADLLSTFADIFQMRTLETKESILSSKLNTKVFSDKINIIENPKADNAIIKEYFDSEGVLTTYKEIINKGVFQKALNDLEYAIKTKTDPTGNANLINNLYIKPGNKSLDDLINEMQDGIIIDEVFGLHSGVDIKSGNISLQSQGLLVENGKIIRGLKMIILSTNLLELFNSVLEIGNDMSKTDLRISCPSILFENITVTGEEK